MMAMPIFRNTAELRPAPSTQLPTRRLFLAHRRPQRASCVASANTGPAGQPAEPIPATQREEEVRNTFPKALPPPSPTGEKPGVYGGFPISRNPVELNNSPTSKGGPQLQLHYVNSHRGAPRLLLVHGIESWANN